jgi:two-component system chemotaxis response regulator CheY
MDPMKKILVVDDSDTARNYHAYILKTGGYEVIGAKDGAEALELLLDQSVDCILTDLNMPKMDGLTLIGRIREYPSYEEIPIIVITTLDGMKDKKRGFEAGANLYIVKPADPKSLLEHLRLILGN